MAVAGMLLAVRENSVWSLIIWANCLKSCH
jgi:hypothetical protein